MQECTLSNVLHICRDELLQLAKNGELLETDMEEMRRELLEEKKHKRKLEKILADCAKALKTALTVRTLIYYQLYLASHMSIYLYVVGSVTIF